MPGPPIHRLLHPGRHKKATKRTRHCAMGDEYVVGGYRENGWNTDCQGLSMTFVPLAALMFLLGKSSTVIGGWTIRR